jgi:hypothetical protein
LIWDGLLAYEAAGCREQATLLRLLFFGPSPVEPAAVNWRLPQLAEDRLRAARGRQSANGFRPQLDSALAGLAEFLEQWLPSEVAGRLPASHRRAPTTGPSRTQRWRRRGVVIAAALLAGGGTAVGFAAAGGNSPAAAPKTVSGVVVCESGAAVVGVWVQAPVSSDSGWAQQMKVGANRARYEYSLHGSSYAVHVGCGGTPTQWASDNRSAFVPVGAHSFVCIDHPASSRERTLGTCRVK